jgi:hypothetical protein
MPDATNPAHLVHLGIVLKEMGLSHIKSALIENLLMEKGKTPDTNVAEAESNFTNAILNKSIKYKNAKGEDKEGIVGNLLRLPKESPGRVAAEKMLPADGTPERDEINKDLGGQNQPKSAEEPKGGEGDEAGGGEEDKAKAAQAMFDPKADPAMAARMDTEKEVQAQLAKDAEADKEVEKEQEPKKEDEFTPIDSKDVAKEMPQADPETFNGDSDIPDGVTPEELEKFNTDISKVAQQIADAKAKGEPAPNINLCDVTVPGTNLYCDDNLGIPRDEMPQFKGTAQPGSRAAGMEADESGEVDTEPVFKEMLKEKGIKTLQTQIPADKLKATQKDLVGAKVIGMMGALEKDPNHPKITAPIYVSRDGHVIDGHHRWAAIVAYNAAHPDSPIPMKTTVLDMDIKDAIPMANKFAEDMGIAAKKADANKEDVPSEPTKREPANDDPESKAQKFKGNKSGEEIQTMEMEGGGFVYGTKHGNTAMVDDILDDVKSKIPKERWKDIVFVGEGGATNDETGEIDFNDEMDYAAPKFKELGAGVDTWDGDDMDVHKSDSKLYQKQKEKTGLKDNQILAGNWASMVGQGEGEGLDPNDPEHTMKSKDYLDDEGKQFLQDAAKEAGLPPIENFDNPTGEKPSEENGWKGTGDRGTLYRLSFPDDNGDKPTKINDIQVAFNDARDEHLIEKNKELTAQGKIPITIAGESHVDLVDKMTRKDKKTGATPTSSASPTTSTPSAPTSAPKLTDKVKQKISNWTEKEKAFFERNEGAPGSKERRSLGQALKDKAAGALKAIKKGAKHEVEEFKEAGKGVQNFFSGKPLSEKEEKALKAVAFKVVTTAVFGAAFGGLSHGVAAFGKHVAMEFIPHIIGETILKGVGKAAVFADAEGEAETDANVLKFTEMIAKGLEEMEITPEMMEQMVDSYNEKKEKGQLDNMETPKVKEEHLHLVDELMLEMIYGFIDEVAGEKKFQAISNKSQRIVPFATKASRDAAIKAGTHSKLGGTKNNDTKKEPQSALATDKGVQSRVDREKAALDKIQKDTTPSVQTPKRKGGSLDDLLNSIPDKGKVADLKTKVNRSKDNILNYFKKESKNKKNPYADELGKVSVIMEKIFNGEKLNSSEKKTAARWIRIAEPTEASPDTAKFYIAKEPNNFKNRVKEETGGRGSSTAVFGAFRKHMEDGGLIQISTSTFGGKKSTANQTFVDEDGKTKLLKTKKGENIASVQKDVNGKVSGITIGGLNIKKMDTNEKGISDEERELRKRNNRNVNEYASKIEAGDLDFIDMDNGVVPDSPQNRVIVIKEAIGGMAKRFKDLADKYYIADEETLGLIQKLADFSKKDPNKNPQEWANELQGIFSDIANHEGEPSLKEGWANFAEVYAAIVEMHDNGKGTQNGRCVLLPQSTTLETVDIITIADGTNERKIVTLDGRSVKKGVGGASALTSKTKKSTYKNDKDGKKAEAITKLSESHSTIYELGLEASTKEHIAHQKKYKEDMIAKAKALGVSDNFVKNIQNRLSDPSKCPKPLPKGNSCGAAHNSITEAINTLIKKRDEKGLPTDEATMQKIRMRLESYYYYTFLSHEAYNHNVDVQDFSNDSILSQKGDTGGAALARNRKISINSSNGVSILAYPKPEFNVGFSLDGRSSNPGAGRFHNEEKRK